MSDPKAAKLILEVVEPPRLEMPLGKRFDKSLFAAAAPRVAPVRLYLPTRSES